MNTNSNKFELLTEKEFTFEELNQFPTVNAMLDAKYGKEGTSTREAFDKRPMPTIYHQVIAEEEAKKRKRALRVERTGRKADVLAEA